MSWLVTAVSLIFQSKSSRPLFRSKILSQKLLKDHRRGQITVVMNWLPLMLCRLVSKSTFPFSPPSTKRVGGFRADISRSIVINLVNLIRWSVCSRPKLGRLSINLWFILSAGVNRSKRRVMQREILIKSKAMFQQDFL